VQPIPETGRVQKTAQKKELIIYTIGHSNLSIDRLIELLKSSAIETVIDIRTRPFSSYVPHFNRPNLERTLRKEGIEYVFMGDTLGGYPKDSDCYVCDSDRKKMTPDYNVMAGKDWFKEGLKAAIEIGRHKKVVLMCSEEDPNKCHRHHLISQSLAAEGVKVIHIRANGNLENPEFGLNYTDDRQMKDVDKVEVAKRPYGAGDLLNSGNGDGHLVDDSGLYKKKKCEQLSLF